MARRTGFQSNVKRNVPRALLFNKDNFVEWKRTGFDLIAAERIMQNALTLKLQKKKNLESEELQRQLVNLIRQCKTMGELRMITRQFAATMSPPTLLSAMCKVHQVQPTPIHNTEAKAMLESLLSFLEPSVPSLRTEQLAIALSSLSRAAQTPNTPESSLKALQSQLEDQSGSSRLADVDPGTLASLVSSAQTLRYGDKPWWAAASASISSNLSLMQPGDVKRSIYAASSHLVSESRASPHPHKFSPEDPFSYPFWSKAEPTIAQRIRSNELDDLQAASLLRSFSLAASTLQRGKVGNEVWTALSERSQERVQEGSSSATVPLPPQALIDLAWACAVMKEGFGWQGNASERGQEDPTLSSFLATTFTSAAHGITHFDNRQIESLLSAAALALDGRKGSPQASVLAPLATLTAMVSDVVEIRGFEWQGSGALPSSPSPSLSQSRPKAASTCNILHLLAKLGHFEALGLKLGTARKAASRHPLSPQTQVATRSSLLKALYSPAKSLLLPPTSPSTTVGHSVLLSSLIGVEATCNLLAAYERAGPMSPFGSAFILGTLAAQRELSPAQVTGATRQLKPKQVVKALVTLLRAASSSPSFAPPVSPDEEKRAEDLQKGAKALEAAIKNLADLVAAPPSLGSALEPSDLKELKGTISSSPLLKDHPILNLV